MYVEYRNAHAAVEVFRGFLKAWGLKIVSYGVTMERDGFVGTLDLICEVVEVVDGFTWNVGDKIVIDTKYSGLLEIGFKNWKNKHGWNWSPVQKEYHGTQAKQYHYVSGLPFYFGVTQAVPKESENNPIVKLFEVIVDDEMVKNHIAEAEDLFEKFKFYQSTTGFAVRPSMTTCAKCPLFKECQDKHTYPRPEVVDLNAE
jgi:hypothetical protein